MGVMKQGSPSWVTRGGRASRKVSQGLDYLADSPSKGVQASVGELGVSDGDMFKCSRDHLESREEHSKRQSRGTSLKRSEAQRMWSSLEASRYRKLKPRVKKSLGMSQLITLSFSIKGVAS